MLRRLSTFLVPAIVLAGLVSNGFSARAARTVAAQDAPPATVLDGVYGAGQAANGRTAYETHCQHCHEIVDDDPQGPPLMGRGFVDRWREETLDILFDYIRTNMPAGSDVPLSDETYLQVVSYILAANGYPARTGTLTSDRTADILLVGMNGPKPLPRNTLVQLVGCFAKEESSDNGLLTRAANPVRIRRVRETGAEELNGLEARPLGTRTFTLRNFRNIRFDFDPAPYNGHKVKVTGVLRQQPGDDRISLTSLETLAPSCGP